MPIEIIASSEAPTAIGPYSQATVANGLVFVAGQVAFNPETMEIVGGGIQEQTARVLDNLAAHKDRRFVPRSNRPESCCAFCRPAALISILSNWRSPN